MLNHLKQGVYEIGCHYITSLIENSLITPNTSSTIVADHAIYQVATSEKFEKIASELKGQALRLTPPTGDILAIKLTPSVDVRNVKKKPLLIIPHIIISKSSSPQEKNSYWSKILFQPSGLQFEIDCLIDSDEHRNVQFLNLSKNGYGFERLVREYAKH